MKKINEVLDTEVLVVDSFQELSYEIGNLGSEVLWICDSNTARMVRPLPEPNVIVVPGESAKLFSSIERIISTASDNYFAKDCTFLALGGGVVCDLAAMAAALYLRGCRVSFIPTTLVAMADACVGAHCGVNYKNIRNLISTVYPAERVIICTECLKSLPDKDFKQGLAYILRLALLSENEDLYRLLVVDKNKVLDKDLSTLEKAIELSINIKKGYVEENQRWGLDLGLTFANALSGIEKNTFSEGQALAWGVCMALKTSEALGKSSSDFARGGIRLFQSYGFNADFKINRGSWIEFKSQLLKNRKINGNVLNFTLIEGQGKPFFGQLDEEIIKKTVIAQPN